MGVGVLVLVGVGGKVGGGGGNTFTTILSLPPQSIQPGKLVLPPLKSASGLPDACPPEAPPM